MIQRKDYSISPWREPWKVRTSAFAIAERLYYVGNRHVSCHLLETDAGLILIDTAFAETTYLLTESIRSLGFEPGQIKIILHAHGHVDHCGATRRLKELSGAVAALSEADVETVENGTPLTCAQYIYGIERFETFKVDRPLKHGDRIELGGVVIHCHHTPGHTAGVMTYTFPVMVDGRRLTAGLFGGPGLWTLRDEHRGSQGYPGNRRDFARSLAYLRDLKVEVWLGAHPGQNQTLEKEKRLRQGEAPNPFIDPAGWRRFIERIEKEFQGLLTGKAG